MYCYNQFSGRFRCLVGSALDHRSLSLELEFRLGHIWRVFYLWLPFITFGGPSAHLAYHMHTGVCKTSIKHHKQNLIVRTWCMSKCQLCNISIFLLNSVFMLHSRTLPTSNLVTIHWWHILHIIYFCLFNLVNNLFDFCSNYLLSNIYF